MVAQAHHEADVVGDDEDRRAVGAHPLERLLEDRRPRRRRGRWSARRAASAPAPRRAPPPARRSGRRRTRGRAPAGRGRRRGRTRRARPRPARRSARSRPQPPPRTQDEVGAGVAGAEVLGGEHVGLARVSSIISPRCWKLRPIPSAARWWAARAVTSSSAEVHPAAVEALQTADAVEQRRLARAVGADEADDGTLVDVERHAAEGLQPAERQRGVPTSSRWSRDARARAASTPRRATRGGRAALPAGGVGRLDRGRGHRSRARADDDQRQPADAAGDQLLVLDPHLAGVAGVVPGQADGGEARRRRATRSPASVRGRRRRCMVRSFASAASWRPIPLRPAWCWVRVRIRPIGAP